MPGKPLTSHHLRGVALSVAICTVFGAIWVVSGGAALPGVWHWLAVALVLVVTVVLLRTAFAFRRSAKRSPSSTEPSVNPFRTPSYWLAVGAEIIAIPLASRVLTANGFPEAVMPAVVAIVGLHFFGLVPAFRSRYFDWVGGAFCAVALAALALPVRATLGGGEVNLRAAFVGLGCAVVLWLGTVPMIARTRRQLGRVNVS